MQTVLTLFPLLILSLSSSVGEAARLIGCWYLLGTDGPGAAGRKHQALFLYCVYSTAVSAEPTPHT